MTAGSTAPTTGPTEADQAAAGGTPMRIVEAWAAYDADAFANVFTEDGTMILPGLYKKGRKEIREFMAEAFAGPYKGTHVTGQPLDVQFHGPDTGVIITSGGVLPAGEFEVPDDQTIHATWVVVKKDGQWQLAAYQNSPSNPN